MTCVIHALSMLLNPLMKLSTAGFFVVLMLVGGFQTATAQSVGATDTKSQGKADAHTTAATKLETVRADASVAVKTNVSGATAKVEQGTAAPVESPSAKNERLEKEKVAADEAARAAEAQRAAESAGALARGEGERYAARLKAYEAARAGIGRVPAQPVKKTSLAQAQLPNGRWVVIAGVDRKEFSSKTEADRFVAEIKQAEFDSPIVLDSAPRK